MAFLVVWDCCSDQSTLWQCQVLTISVRPYSINTVRLTLMFNTITSLRA